MPVTNKSALFFCLKYLYQNKSKLFAFFTNNSATGYGAYGGAIFNSEKSNGIGKIVNSTFENNIVSSVVEGGIALGGAIYTEQDITLEADGEGKILSFSGNKTVNDKGEISNNAIFMNFTSPRLIPHSQPEVQSM